MELREFIKNFNISKPNWNLLPQEFPKCSMDGLTSSEVGKFMGIKTMWELKQIKKKGPQSKSRAWNAGGGGYRFLIVWTNAVLLRLLIKKLTDSFFDSRLPYNPLNSSKGPYGNLKEFSKLPYNPLYSSNSGTLKRLKSQMDDAARSVIANIEEGFKRATTSEYLQFLGYSQGSLEEVKGDMERCAQDKILPSKPNFTLQDIGINLKDWNEWCRNPSNTPRIHYFPLESPKGVYRNLSQIEAKDLTYEIFKELINKTDWGLRKLVESLEKKLTSDKKAYQIQKAKIKDRIKWQK